MLNIDDGTVNRGISLCSRADNFNFHFARTKAFGRMMSACSNKRTFNEIKAYKGDCEDALCPDAPFLYKSYFRDILTESEKRMLRNPIEK